MHDQPTALPIAEDRNPSEATSTARWRVHLRDTALRNALQKRATGVPTYSVPEAAALLSISQEYLYRLVQAGGFPAVRLRLGGNQGRYVVPANAVEQLLSDAADTGRCVDAAEWTSDWRRTASAPVEVPSWPR